MNIAIVGSNRGIGLELVKQFNFNKNHVYAFCRKASKDLVEVSPHEIIENFDVTDEKSMKSIISNQTADKFDVVIHVSGILKEDDQGDFEENLTSQFKVNAIGPINSFRSFAPFLPDGSKFAVVTSQLGSITNNQSGGRFGYRMSKAAANMACKNLAIDGMKENITVFALHPGYVETDMTGHSANISADTSAEGLKKLVDNMSPSQAGTFWHVNGEELPW